MNGELKTVTKLFFNLFSFTLLFNSVVSLLQDVVVKYAWGCISSKNNELWAAQCHRNSPWCWHVSVLILRYVLGAWVFVLCTAVVAGC